MSNNYHKTEICGVCGKVMRDDNLKRHMSSKHGNTESVVQRGEGQHQPQRENTFATKAHSEDARQYQPFKERPTEAYNQDNDASAETAGYDEKLINASKLNCTDVDAKLEFELTNDKDAYWKNVKLGERISIVLSKGEIPEKSLSKQHKFCLELFQAQRPTVDRIKLIVLLHSLAR